MSALYFEESWAILSSIGLVNVLIGGMVIGITSFSPVAVVPIVCSVACAIANGMCYYAFYADYPRANTVAAAAVGDLSCSRQTGLTTFILEIQEAGLSFYSYLILVRVLRGKERVIFISLFWSIMVVLLGLRITILISRAQQILKGDNHLQRLVDHLHVGYFTSLAIIEVISSMFLLRKFSKARKTSQEAASSSGLFSYLMRSTEIRLATLAIIGITRAVTYSFQTEEQSASSVASQIDRFVYTLECIFPVIMFVDILASKLVVTNHIHESSSNRAYTKSSGGRRRGANGGRDIAMYSMNAVETRVDAVSSSQEHIVQEPRVSMSGDNKELDGKGGISKTVEFEFFVEAAPR